ncbi:unnamed protein product [Mycena citricolor]|nr:unnamed protein product [Mycena citricolor]
MQLTSALLSLAVLLTSTAQAAPSVGVTSSLTKRWCGFDATCGCTPDPAAGCELTFDKCGQQWYWPSHCKGCQADCPDHCVLFFHCIDPSPPK